MQKKTKSKVVKVGKEDTVIYDVTNGCKGRVTITFNDIGALLKFESVLNDGSISHTVLPTIMPTREGSVKVVGMFC